MTKKKVKKVEVPEVVPEVKAEPEVVEAPPKKKRVKKPKVVEEVKPPEEKVEETPVLEPGPKLEDEITEVDFEDAPAEEKAEVAPEPQAEEKPDITKTERFQKIYKDVRERFMAIKGKAKK